jgi:hypothetical protein
MSRRLGLWVTVLALPVAALALLAAEPDVDRRWEHHPSHFWLVLTVAGVNVALGLIASEAASRRDDDRTFLVTFRFGQSSVSLAGQPARPTAHDRAPFLVGWWRPMATAHQMASRPAAMNPAAARVCRSWGR